MDKTRLLQLFRVCSEASCGALIDPSEVKTVEAGAALTVTATCLNNHVQKWSSSGTVREGRKEQFTINILLAAYTLFCGLNISQVRPPNLHPDKRFATFAWDDVQIQILNIPLPPPTKKHQKAIFVKTKKYKTA